jgi:hypothetical protein
MERVREPGNFSTLYQLMYRYVHYRYDNHDNHIRYSKYHTLL